MKIPTPKAEPRSNGLPVPERLPWNEALLVAVRRLERENAELKATVTRQRKSIDEARRRLENWQLRQQAWRHERAELLEKIKTFSL